MLICQCGGGYLSEFITDNHVKNLPDSYCKTLDSNNFKLLELERLTMEEYRQTLQQIYDVLDLDNAKGKTLDMYGDMVGQARGNTTDEQYLLMIKAKLMRNLSNGSHPSILNALSVTFNCSPSQISVVESENPCSVEVVALPLKTIIQANISTDDTLELIKQLLPVGVTLQSYLFDGTFTFSSIEDEYNEEEGFCDVEGGTIGGYFGMTGGIKYG